MVFLLFLFFFLFFSFFFHCSFFLPAPLLLGTCGTAHRTAGLYCSIDAAQARPATVTRPRTPADSAGVLSMYSMRKDSEAVLGVWCPASQPPGRSPLGLGMLWLLA